MKKLLLLLLFLLVLPCRAYELPSFRSEVMPMEKRTLMSHLPKPAVYPVLRILAPVVTQPKDLLSRLLRFNPALHIRMGKNTMLLLAIK